MKCWLPRAFIVKTNVPTRMNYNIRLYAHASSGSKGIVKIVKGAGVSCAPTEEACDQAGVIVKASTGWMPTRGCDSANLRTSVSACSKAAISSLSSPL